MFPDPLLVEARALVDVMKAKGLKLVTAESCTGGLIAGLITEIPGSSAVLERGFVTYSNEAKIELIAVPDMIISAYGAVSAETARAMAEGALAASRADIAVSVTGIAGPDGGSAQKPVGLVHFAAANKDGRILHEEHRFGAIGREQVRLASVAAALALIRRAMP